MKCITSVGVGPLHKDWIILHDQSTRWLPMAEQWTQIIYKFRSIESPTTESKSMCQSSFEFHRQKITSESAVQFTFQSDASITHSAYSSSFLLLFVCDSFGSFELRKIFQSRRIKLKRETRTAIRNVEWNNIPLVYRRNFHKCFMNVMEQKIAKLQ